MSQERIYCLVTYNGDRTKFLSSVDSLCPYRLTPEGNTEQEILCRRSPGDVGAPAVDIVMHVEPYLRHDAAAVGKVIGMRWVILKKTTEQNKDENYE